MVRHGHERGCSDDATGTAGHVSRDLDPLVRIPRCLPSGLSPSVLEFHQVNRPLDAVGSRTVTAGSELHRPRSAYCCDHASRPGALRGIRYIAPWTDTAQCMQCRAMLCGCLDRTRLPQSPLTFTIWERVWRITTRSAASSITTSIGL